MADELVLHPPGEERTFLAGRTGALLETLLSEVGDESNESSR